ncbi:hypothetical protein GCM10023188_34520 [Pontibacter saemangeumensis]|uniref:Rho-binding antiterminator n=1 Tax=Pontibacter saemangeumensis TaxID=1084525 RepID=A0ABP8LZG4_9BACT
MEQAYKQVDRDFVAVLADLVAKQPFIRIQYYSEIREFINVTAVPKELIEKNGEEYLRLATGEEIRLDRLVRIGDHRAPGYSEDYFKCDL